MNVTYLCGGINGLSDKECKDWREVAVESLVGSTVDPMRRDYRGIEDQSVNEIVGGDIDDIKESTHILVNATKPSWGTAMEIVYAHQRGLPIMSFVGTSRVSPWLRFHSTAIVNTVEEACYWINNNPVTKKKMDDA